jgi:hypothetical protein
MILGEDDLKKFYELAHKQVAAAAEFNLEQLLEEIQAKEETGYPDTGEYDEEKENHMRQEMELWAAYDESGKGFDPEGKYLCRTCEERIEPDGCKWVSGKISMDTGSSRLYSHGPDRQEEKPAPRQLTQIQAQYAERPLTKRFGCAACEYGAEAKKPDAKGRKSWCRFWGAHVIPNACCAMHDGPDMQEPTQ